MIRSVNSVATLDSLLMFAWRGIGERWFAMGWFARSGWMIGI